MSKLLSKLTIASVTIAGVVVGGTYLASTQSNNNRGRAEIRVK